MSFIDNFATAESGEGFGGNEMMFDQLNSSEMKFDYSLIGDGIENPDFDDRNDFLSADPRFNSSENDNDESVMSDGTPVAKDMPANITRSHNMNLGMMHPPPINNNNAVNHLPSSHFRSMSSSNHMGVPGSIGMSNDFDPNSLNTDLPPPVPHSRTTNRSLSHNSAPYPPLSTNQSVNNRMNANASPATLGYNLSHSNNAHSNNALSNNALSNNAHSNNGHSNNGHSNNAHSNTPPPSIASEFTPPFVVDLPMVRRTMDGVNRALGVDLTGNDVGESVLVAKPNGDMKSDENDGRDTNSAGKTEVSHARLITEACGFIVASVGRAVIEAAHESCVQDLEKGLRPSAPKAPIRKKRGGIIGFKELASRSNLSAWHFHRVFRSVTGVTPKAYGEALWEYLMLEAGFDLENEELTISRTLPPSQLSPNTRQDHGHLPAPSSTPAPTFASSDSPPSQELSPGLSSTTSMGSKMPSPPRSADSVDSRSFAKSRASSPSETKNSDLVKPEPVVKPEPSQNDSDLTNSYSNSSAVASTDNDESSSTQSQPGTNHAPLAGTVVPGRVSKTASRSRGARSRSRNRSQSQSQVFSAFKSENGVVSDEKQPVRRGRSFSRVSQRPGVLNGSSMNRTSHSVGTNPGMMTPMMATNNGSFSPASNGMNNMNAMSSMNSMPTMPNAMNNLNGMSNMANMNMGMMNNNMMMKNGQMGLSDDYVGDSFHPTTEMIMNNVNYPFDVPDLNNLTLYSQDRRANPRYSTGAEQMQMLMPMNGDTGVEMPDTITTPQGVFPTPRRNSAMNHPNQMAHRYPLKAEDPFDFSALPPGPGGMDSFYRESDHFGEPGTNRSAKALAGVGHPTDGTNSARPAPRGRHQHTQSEQIHMSPMAYGGPNRSARNPSDLDSSDSVAVGNGASKHHRSYTTMDNLAFDTDHMPGFANLRSNTPPSLVNGLSNNGNSPLVNQTPVPSSSSTTSTGLPAESFHRSDFFYPGNLNWDMYNDPSDAASKSDQLGDLPPSFYGGFGDSPIFSEDSKTGNDMVDLHSVMIGEDEPPLPTNWQNDANLGYASF